MKRQGLGRGLGRGYKNIAHKDPYIHGLSAKGVKTYLVSFRPKSSVSNPKFEHYWERSNIYVSKRWAEKLADKKKKQGYEVQFEKLDAKGELTPEEQKRVDGLTSELGYNSNVLLEIESELDDRIDSVEDYNIDYLGDRDGWKLLKTESGEEWVLAPSEDECEEVAKEIVEEMLESEPELFTKDWLKQYITLSDTDRRCIAGDEADAYVDAMDDEDLIKDADMVDEYEEIDEKLNKEGLTDSEQLNLEQERDNLVEKARNEVYERRYDEVYDDLQDPHEYFVVEQGMYSEDEFIKHFGSNIDIREASEDAVNTDGWEHFLSKYDGNSITLPSGKVLFRDN